MNIDEKDKKVEFIPLVAFSFKNLFQACAKCFFKLVLVAFSSLFFAIFQTYFRCFFKLVLGAFSSLFLCVFSSLFSVLIEACFVCVF